MIIGNADGASWKETRKLSGCSIVVRICPNNQRLPIEKCLRLYFGSTLFSFDVLAGLASIYCEKSKFKGSEKGRRYDQLVAHQSKEIAQK